MDNNKISFNQKKYKIFNEKLSQKEYIELLRNYNNYNSKEKIKEQKNQNISVEEISSNSKIIQLNKGLKASNSTITINEKRENTQRENLNSKTPDRMKILNKNSSNIQNIKNIFKHNRSPPILNQSEIGDYLKKKIENNKYITNEKIKEKDDMSTLSTSTFSTPVKSEEKRENLINKAKKKYQNNIIGKTSITPERIVNINKKKFNLKDSISTSVDTKRNENNEKKYQTLNIEDLIMIEDKFNNILKNVYNKNFKVVSKICYEWWNFYFNCSLKGNCEYLFNNKQIKSLINNYNSLLLISIMIVYDLSFKDVYFYKCLDMVKNILFLNQQNYLNLCQYLLTRITKEYLRSKWVEQLKNIINQKKKEFSSNVFQEIEKNLLSLHKLITILLMTINSHRQTLNPRIMEVFSNYNTITSDIINKYFMTNILHIDNESGSLLFSSLRSSFPKTNNYILSNPPNKQLTLILDLDETLMSFVYTKEKVGQGISRIRPFLYNFLNLVKEYYELIIFTASTQIYADPILDAIEGIKGQYFNYRLYRNHCCILDNNFVKDISLLGRDLSKTIIVDNMQQNFKLQKENGILISSFWGEDINDRALLQLGRILVNIAKDMIFCNYNNDIRNLIFKYKDDIVKNVSMG